MVYLGSFVGAATTAVMVDGRTSAVSPTAPWGTPSSTQSTVRSERRGPGTARRRGVGKFGDQAHGAARRARRAVEQREDAVAGVHDDAAANFVDRSLCQLVVPVEHITPALITRGGELRRRLDEWRLLAA